MKASFFFSSFPSLGFLFRRFLAFTRPLAFFSSGVGLMAASAKLRALSLDLGKLQLLVPLAVDLIFQIGEVTGELVVYGHQAMSHP